MISSSACNLSIVANLVALNRKTVADGFSAKVTFSFIFSFWSHFTLSPQSTLVIRSHYGYLEISTRIWKSTHGTSHPWTGHCHLRDGATPLNNYCDHAAGKTIRQSSPISDGTGFSHGSECSEEEAVHGKTRNSLVCPPSPLPPACWPVSLHCLPSGWMDGSAVCWSPSYQQKYNVHFHIYAFSKCSLGWNVSSRLWQRSSFQIWSPIMRGNKRGWDCFETRQAQLGVGTHFGNFSKLYIGNLATVCFDELHICDIKVHPSQCSGDSCLTQEKHPYDEICLRQTEVPWYTKYNVHRWLCSWQTRSQLVSLSRHIVQQRSRHLVCLHGQHWTCASSTLCCWIDASSSKQHWMNYAQVTARLTSACSRRRGGGDEGPLGVGWTDHQRFSLEMRDKGDWAGKRLPPVGLSHIVWL